jgi:uncharacterized protein YndB with AHSA1/START domain
LARADPQDRRLLVAWRGIHRRAIEDPAMAETTAQASKIISAPPAKVWEALVTPAIIKRYFFGADVESDFRVGSPIRFRGEFKGKSYEDKGEVLAVKPQKTLSMSHWSPLSGEPDAPENYHVVTYTLEPDGERTRVTLTQSNLQGGVKASDVSHRQEYEKNWAMVLDGLEKTLRA